MNNTEVHEAISVGDASFYWMHLVNGEQYLIPFMCQRCGNCCRVVFDAPCRYFREPNICTIYDKRPLGCRGFPVHTDFGTIGIDCQGFKLYRKAIARLGQGIGYWVGHGSDDVFKPSTQLSKAIAKLEKGNLPRGFIDRFVELNKWIEKESE